MQRMQSRSKKTYTMHDDSLESRASNQVNGSQVGDLDALLNSHVEVAELGYHQVVTIYGKSRLGYSAVLSVVCAILSAQPLERCAGPISFWDAPPASGLYIRCIRRARCDRFGLDVAV